MTIAYGGDYSRDAARYYRLVNAIRQSTGKLQQIGRDERASPDETLRSLLEELVAALTAESTFIAKYQIGGDGRESLKILQTVNNPSTKKKIAPPTCLPFIDPLKKVVQTGSPVVIAPTSPATAAPISALEAFSAISAILLRIETIEETYLVGICNAMDPENDPFIVSDRVTAEHILELAAVGIRAGERQRSDFQFIHEIFGPASSEMPYQTQLNHIVESARSAFEAEAVSLMLWRSAETELRVEAFSGLSYDYCADQRIPRKVALAWLEQESQRKGEHVPFVIDNLQETPLGDRQLILEEDLHSVLCAPLIVKELEGNTSGGFTGVLNIYSKGKLRPFSGIEKDFARIFAEQSAVAVQASRLLDEQRRKQSAIREIGETVTRGDAQIVWETISRKAAELTSANYATLVRLSRNRIPGDELHGSGRHILSPAGTWYAAGIDKWITEPWKLPYSNDSMIGRVIGNNAEEYLPDVSANPDRFRILATHTDLPPITVKSAYCVPLQIDDQSIGAIYIASNREDAFTLHDRETLKLIAPHAAIALRNVDLKELDAKAIEFQTSIADVMNPNDQAGQIVANLKASGYDVSGCFLALINRQTRKLEFLFAEEPNSDATTDEHKLRYARSRFGTRQGLIEWVINEDSSLLVHDFDADERRQHIDLVCRRGVRSCLVIPMRVNGKSIGVLGLRSYRHTNEYDERDQELLEKLAPHIAVVLANSQQYAEKVRGLQAVSKYQQELSLLDTSKPYAFVDQGIENIYEHARKTIEDIGMLTDHMFIVLYNETTHRLEYKLIYEDKVRINTKAHPHPSYRDRRLGEYPDLIEWLIRSNQPEPMLFETPEQMTRWADVLRESGSEVILPTRSKCWLAAPMIANGKRIGVMGLRSFQDESVFSDGHKELMQVLANQAAISVENARLYENGKSSMAVALMGAWGADIVHDVNRESQEIQWSARRLKSLVNEAKPTEDPQPLLDNIQRAARELSLPTLPIIQPETHGEGENIRSGPALQRVLTSEIEYQRKKSGRIEIRGDFAKEPIRVAMHEQWIRRMLRHLIKNASRHLERTRGSGTITISIREDDGFAIVLVKDNGLGVREDIQLLLFQEPTPHVDERKNQHQGRGLMLVRFVTSMHGGEAKLEWTTPQQGSCFSFSIPIVETDKENRDV